jgi:hypothetical protein
MASFLAGVFHAHGGQHHHTVNGANGISLATIPI